MGNDADREPKYEATAFSIRAFLLVAAADAHITEPAEQMLIRHAQR